MNADSVSVVIPYHNEGPLILRAIASVCEQAHGGSLEIIVVDDGSDSPPPLPVDSRWPIHLVRTESALHAAGARNLGVTQASGEYVCFLDADDVYVPGCIEQHVRFLGDHPAAVIVGGKSIIHRDDVQLVVPWLIAECFPWLSEERGLLPEATSQRIVERYLFNTGAFTVRRRAFERVGGFEARYRSNAEWDLQVRLAQLGRVGYVPLPAMHYLCRSASITSTLNPAKFESLAQMSTTWRRTIRGLSRRQRGELRREEHRWLLLAAQVYLEDRKQPHKALACALDANTRCPSLWGFRSLFRMGLNALVFPGVTVPARCG